ncbi:hypothetical protein GX411_05610 [Candidatus Fermentibacteria bacterium]|nr:hypothetical protein [Candidatus Fermentibacteria bacterium]
MTVERDSSGRNPAGDIIAALATPDGPGALAIVRLCGANCTRLAEKCISLSPMTLNGRKRAIGSFEGMSGPASAVVAISWPRGASYTGEEMVELICSGAPGVADAVLGRLFRDGARVAAPGEFTRRALLNGRISPLEVLELSAAFRGAATAGRSASALVADLSRALAEARAALDGAIEFHDSHLEGEGPAALGGRFDRLLETASAVTAAASEVSDPDRVFITGPRNAGKSSLFNFLTGREAALVSDCPGTTREGLRESTDIGSGKIELRDTAGWTGEDGLDSMALAKVLEEMREGDCVVWMSPRGRDPVPEAILQRKPRLVSVSSRCDEGRGPGLNVSVLRPEGIEDLKRWIAARRPVHGPGAAASIVEDLLREACAALRAGDAALASALAAEADTALSEVSDLPAGCGDSIERALGSLCVGK